MDEVFCGVEDGDDGRESDDHQLSCLFAFVYEGGGGAGFGLK